MTRIHRTVSVREKVRILLSWMACPPCAQTTVCSPWRGCSGKGGSCERGVFIQYSYFLPLFAQSIRISVAFRSFEGCQTSGHRSLNSKWSTHINAQTDKSRTGTGKEATKEKSSVKGYGRVLGVKDQSTLQTQGDRGLASSTLGGTQSS